MQYNFLNIFLEKKDLLSQEKSMSPVDQFLLENNSSQVGKFYDFYNNESDFLCVNGFLGTGKAQIVDYSLSFLSQEAIVLKYNCFESTILDDVLLSFFSDFKKLSVQKIIEEPKIKTENFVQKVNSYFSNIEKPFLIVMNSFETILAENRREILDFLLHLSSFSKIKIILISKTFESEYFPPQTKYDRVSITALEKPLFEKYLKSQKVKSNNILLDEFYKNTRGYFFYTALSVKVIQHNEVSLEDFLKEFAQSFLTFDNFLKKKATEIIPATSRNLFWFLSMVRHSISIDLLKVLNFYDAERIEFLIKNLIISDEDSLLCIKDYFGEQVDTSIAPNIAQKIRRYIIDLYKTQLPLKPLDRNILISRQTMRKEIEYHSLFLPKRPKNIDNADVEISYLAYAKGLEFDYGHLKPKEMDKFKQEEKPQTQSDSSPLPSVKNPDLSNLNLKDLPFQLSPEEMNLLGDKDSSFELGGLFTEEAKPEFEEEFFSLAEIMQRAKSAEDAYHYMKAIDLYKKALECEDDGNYSTQLPTIYTRIARIYQKISDNENALKYFMLAQKLYETSKEFVKANYIKLNISKIFYDSYKFENTKETLLDILKFAGNPAVLNTKTYLQLANLEVNLSNQQDAFEYYKKAVDISNDAMDVETLSELYFKYALVLDDKNDAQGAIEFYQKCINLGNESNLNKFLSSAYSNIAALYLEKNDNNSAVKNYIKAYEIDRQHNNYDGMYYAASKLAVALQRKYPDEALKFFNKALECAKMLNDTFYIASASLAVGDFYYDKKQDEVALKHYVYALELVKNEFSKDNIDKIKMRINDIKFRMGEEGFAQAMEKFEKEKNG